MALLVETSHGFGRQLLHGIARYSHLHGPWSFYVTPGDFEQVVPKMLEWGGDGIIARVANRNIEQAILDAGVPTITLERSTATVSDDDRLEHISEIRVNSYKVGQLAADHLVERYYRHYAYIGAYGRSWSEERESGFRDRLAENGFETHIYPIPTKKADRVWERESHQIGAWIADLPKPLAIMACNDDRGREVLDACNLVGLNSPEDVAVVGVDNDELFCELADPPLSSVAFNVEDGGYRAAELLDQMMTHKSRKRQTVMIEPIHVVTRRSSDVIALADREVASALTFIHQAMGRNITVDEVAKHLAVSRRYIEVRFRKALGRTILSEITRVRLAHAKRLLELTDYPIPRIADLAGYNSASYLITVFRQNNGITPAQYRKSLRV